jgi:hypothetical protein
MLGSLLKDLAIAAGRAAAERLVKLIRREVRARPSSPSQPLTFKDVEHIRAQERASIEASKKAAAAKPKPGKLTR